MEFPSSSSGNSERKILILDDDILLLFVTKINLTNIGYTVETISNATMFEEKVRVFQPHIILMDVRLNTADGRFICKKFKESNQDEKTPVILISSDPNIAKEYKVFKADDFIQKPFETKTIVERTNLLYKQVN